MKNKLNIDIERGNWVNLLHSDCNPVLVSTMDSDGLCTGHTQRGASVYFHVDAVIAVVEAPAPLVVEPEPEPEVIEAVTEPAPVV